MKIVIIFVGVVLVIAAILDYKEKSAAKQKQHQIQAHQESLQEEAINVQCTEICTVLTKYIHDEIKKREVRYREDLQFKLSYTPTASTDCRFINDWLKDRKRAVFQLQEDGLYTYEYPLDRDDYPQSCLIVSYKHLGYLNLATHQIEVLTSALGQKISDYTATKTKKLEHFQRRYDDKREKYRQMAIDDPAHYSFFQDGTTYSFAKIVLCELTPTDEYLMRFVESFLLQMAKAKKQENSKLKIPF